ncbi:MAG TPA: hypothetical protein VG845_01330, partial [Dehalococcoidia bacterium]|nr:hypothetical protein [Dehalococcoidia bacterium]
MTPEEELPPPEKRPARRRRPEQQSPRPVNGADQGDLWADPPASAPDVPTNQAAPEPETAAPPEVEQDLDSFISDLPPPDENDEQVTPLAPARARGARRRATAGTLAAPVEPSTYEEYEYEDAYYEPDPEYSMLRNPYVLAGLAVAIAIVAAVFVVVLFGSGGESGGFNNNGVVSQPLTPQP